MTPALIAALVVLAVFVADDIRLRRALYRSEGLRQVAEHDRDHTRVEAQRAVDTIERRAAEHIEDLADRIELVTSQFQRLTAGEAA